MCGASFYQGATIGFDPDTRKVVQCLACTPTLAGDAAPSTVSGAPARFQCTVRSVKYSNPDGFGILMVRFAAEVPDNAPYDKTRDFGIKGRVGNVSPEDTLEVTGSWVTVPKYGEIRALAFLDTEVRPTRGGPNLAGVERREPEQRPWYRARYARAPA